MVRFGDCGVLGKEKRWQQRGEEFLGWSFWVFGKMDRDYLQRIGLIGKGQDLKVNVCMVVERRGQYIGGYLGWYLGKIGGLEKELGSYLLS